MSMQAAIHGSRCHGPSLHTALFCTKLFFSSRLFHVYSFTPTLRLFWYFQVYSSLVLVD